MPWSDGSKKIRRYGSVLIVNVAVLAFVLSGIEISSRLYLASAGQPRSVDVDVSGSIAFQFYPYWMTGQARNFHYRKWIDARHRTFDVDVATNNFGFPDAQDFDISQPYAKKSGEKIVLLTGGSTAFGVGATSNSNITHEKLAQLLNATQSDFHYTVINLAQGGWIAQQEDVSLDIWGRIFNPDWIITLDGVNDSTVGCAMSQGTGNPVYFQLINALVTGYLSSQATAVFYRGYLENQLIRYSTAYRLLTGKSYIAPPAHLDHNFKDSLLQVTAPTRISEIKNQIGFYVLSETSMLERFQDAKFLLTTQPTAQDFAFGLGDFYLDGDGYAADMEKRQKFSDELDKWIEFSKPDERYCTGAPETIGYVVRYILAKSAIRLAALVDDYRDRHRRDVEYYNTGLLYPKDLARRADYFIDDYHLNDLGQDYLAHYYAYSILRRDFPNRDWSRIRPKALWFQ
jgi:hypothetical protein